MRDTLDEAERDEQGFAQVAGEIAAPTVGDLLVELILRNVGAWIQREGDRWRVDVSTKKGDRRFWADTEVAALSAAIKWLDTKK
jgi:hypothetical protein